MITPTANISVYGPVDGMDEGHPKGSYIRFTVGNQRFRVSRGAAEVLVAELQEALDEQSKLAEAHATIRALCDIFEEIEQEAQETMESDTGSNPAYLNCGWLKRKCIEALVRGREALGHDL